MPMDWRSVTEFDDGSRHHGRTRFAGFAVFARQAQQFSRGDGLASINILSSS
jgi:hypothetical protein